MSGPTVAHCTCSPRRHSNRRRAVTRRNEYEIHRPRAYRAQHAPAESRSDNCAAPTSRPLSANSIRLRDRRRDADSRGLADRINFKCENIFGRNFNILQDAGKSQVPGRGQVQEYSRWHSSKDDESSTSSCCPFSLAQSDSSVGHPCRPHEIACSPP
jgi:hypothetical protein